MIFDAQYEFALRAVAFGIVTAGWIIARALLGLPLAHPWLGAMLAGLCAPLTASMAIIPGAGGFVLQTTAITCVFLATVLFTLGVRFEATDTKVGRAGWIAVIALAVAGAALLVLLVHDVGMRLSIMRVLAGLFAAASFIWLVPLMHRRAWRPGAILLGIFVMGLAVDRGVPFAQLLANHGVEPTSYVFPYLARSDLLFIIAGGLVMIYFSAESARRERAA